MTKERQSVRTGGVEVIFGSDDPQLILLLKRIQDIPYNTVARCEAQAALYMMMAKKEWQAAALLEEREAGRAVRREYQRISDERRKNASG